MWPVEKLPWAAEAYAEKLKRGKSHVVAEEEQELKESFQQHKLELLGLDTKISYNVGSVVGICGRIFSHAVDFVPEGERVCLAYYMRENVRKGFNLPEGGFSTVKNIMSTGDIE